MTNLRIPSRAQGNDKIVEDLLFNFNQIRAALPKNLDLTAPDGTTEEQLETLWKNQQQLGDCVTLIINALRGV